MDLSVGSLTSSSAHTDAATIDTEELIHFAEECAFDDREAAARIVRLAAATEEVGQDTLDVLSQQTGQMRRTLVDIDAVQDIQAPVRREIQATGSLWAQVRNTLFPWRRQKPTDTSSKVNKQTKKLIHQEKKEANRAFKDQEKRERQAEGHLTRTPLLKRELRPLTPEEKAQLANMPPEVGVLSPEAQAALVETDIALTQTSDSLHRLRDQALAMRHELNEQDLLLDALGVTSLRAAGEINLNSARIDLIQERYNNL